MFKTNYQSNKKEAGIVLPFILIIFVVGIVAFLLKDKLLNNPALNIPAVPSSTQSSPVTNQAIVEITSQGFVPQTLKVKAGTEVTFVNKDSQDQQLFSDPHPAHNLFAELNLDEPLTPNSSASIILEKAGTYTYHSEKSPLKTIGTIIVE